MALAESVGVFMGLKIAFGTINHSLLLSKTCDLWNKGTWTPMARGLPKNRQSVQMNGYKSECKNFICGIPQGTVLGPVLFILYFN